jgi:hypothetical protein
MYRRILLCLLVVMALASGSASRAGTAGVLTGTGFSEFSECSPDSLQVAINGAEVGPDNWVFDVAAVNSEPTCGLFPAITVPFVGSWTPAGGCVPAVVMDQVIGPLNLCLTSPTANGPMTVYNFSVCEMPSPCGSLENPDTLEVLVVVA